MAVTRLKSKMVFCNVPSKNIQASRQFYSALLGTDLFAPSLNQNVPQLYQPISPDGLNLTISRRQDDREPITCYFAVENLDEALKQLQGAGGIVVVQPQPVPISGPSDAVKLHGAAVEGQGFKAQDTVGRMATMLDPDNNYIGLIEIGDEASKRYFKVSEQHLELDQEQVENLERWRNEAERHLRYK